jgi:hypothetical protein
LRLALGEGWQNEQEGGDGSERANFHHGTEYRKTAVSDQRLAVSGQLKTWVVDEAGGWREGP